MSCASFVAQSLAVRTAAHLAHFAATTYSAHIALGEFYEAVTAKVDTFAEVAMCVEGRFKTFPNVRLPDYSDPVEMLTDYLSEIEEELAEHTSPDHAALNNILAELQAITAQTLYKLRFLK